MSSDDFNSFASLFIPGPPKTRLDALKPVQTIEDGSFVELLNTPDGDIPGLLRSLFSVEPAFTDNSVGGKLPLIKPIAFAGLGSALARPDPNRPPRRGSATLPLKFALYKTPQAILRPWVDEWLNSGRAEDGSEDSRERTLSGGGPAALAAFAYSKSGNISLLASGNSLAVWLKEESRDQPRDVLFRKSGDEIAKQLLVFMLLSKLRFRIAKCRGDGCGAYFLLNHWNRRYKRGTLCIRCRTDSRHAAAMRITGKARKEAAAQLHRLAARHFGHNIRASSSWHTSPRLKMSVAKFLNEKISGSSHLSAIYLVPPRRGVTGKWVARRSNWRGIERALNEIECAKTKRSVKR